MQKAAAVQGGAILGGAPIRRANDVGLDSRAGGRLGGALSLIYTVNLMGHQTSPLPAQAHKSNSPQNNSKPDRFST